MVSLGELIDYGFDPFSSIVYRCFYYYHYIIESIYYIYKIRSVLEISDDFGGFWRYLEQAPEMTIELDIGRYWRGIIDRCSCLDIDRQRSAQKTRFVTADLKPKSSPIYKITPNEF